MQMLALTAEAFGGYGGIAQSTQDLLRALASGTMFDSIDVLPRIVRDRTGETPQKITQRPAIWGRLAYAVEAWRLTAAIRPAVIYCGHVYLAPLAAALSCRYRAKLLTHIHGLEVWDRLNLTRRQGLRHTDLALCVSNDTARHAIENVGLSASQIDVIYNTYGDEFTPGDRAAARRALDIDDEVVLLTVSRLDAKQRHKGHDLVLAQIPRLISSGHKVTYLIAGDGDDKDRLRNIAKMHGVERHVRFLGRVPVGNLPGLYRAADHYVMPSSREGFGISFIEAMACGTPALGLALGGAPEALCDGELGIAVSPQDFPDALTKAIERSPPDRQRLSKAVSARFGRAIFQRRVETALERVLG